MFFTLFVEFGLVQLMLTVRPFRRPQRLLLWWWWSAAGTIIIIILSFLIIITNTYITIIKKRYPTLGPKFLFSLQTFITQRTMHRFQWFLADLHQMSSSFFLARPQGCRTTKKKTFFRVLLPKIHVFLPPTKIIEKTNFELNVSKNAKSNWVCKWVEN